MCTGCTTHERGLKQFGPGFNPFDFVRQYTQGKQTGKSGSGGGSSSAAAAAASAAGAASSAAAAAAAATGEQLSCSTAIDQSCYRNAQSAGALFKQSCADQEQKYRVSIPTYLGTSGAASAAAAAASAAGKATSAAR